MKPDQDDLFIRALRRLRRGATLTLQGAAFAGAIAGATPGCAEPPVEPGVDPDMGPGGKGDWAQDEGERRTDLVSFTGEAWSECRESSSRTGCFAYEMIFKVMVAPVANVEPTAKKVGLVYRSIENGFAGDRTSNGRFFAAHADGREEWHVPVRVFTYEDLIKFNVWYQPGNSKTYYDDNNGEGHVYANNNATQVIQTATWESTVQVIDGKVRGSIRVRVADLDWDKSIGIHATVDGWATTQVFGVGQRGDKNKFYWAEDTFGNNELWQIDLDFDAPADVQELRYAVFYEHGTVNDARRYTFWDNNWGSDYRVQKSSNPGSGGGGTRG